VWSAPGTQQSAAGGHAARRQHQRDAARSGSNPLRCARTPTIQRCSTSAVAVQFHLGRRTTPIREQVTPRTLRYTCIASRFAAGADQDYVAAQVGHEDVTTTNRIYRYVRQRRQRGEIGRRRQLAMRESVAEIGRPLFPGHAAER
jgi:integrase